jgi:cytochrome c-type biogenesis protein CcmH/NrfF
MAKKKKTLPQKREQTVQKKESNFWMITAIVAVTLLLGVTAKTFFSSSQRTVPATATQPTTVQTITIQPATVPVSELVEEQVRQVTMNFKCACGGCGELPLVECQCDMPRGAVEEKSFIRTKLLEGYSVPQIVELVDEKYGHKGT